MIECLQIVKTPMGEILKRIPFITFLFLFTTLGCKISGPKTSTGPLANQTAILSAKAVPDIVAPGDTVQFICRITDSTNTKFRFYWYIFYGTTIGGKDTTYGGLGAYVTSVGRIKWKAPDKLQAYDFEVTADDGDPDLVPVDEAFSVTVKQ